MDKIDVFAVLVLTASSDQILSDAEKQHLWEAGQRWGLSKPDIVAGFQRANDPKYVLPDPATPEEGKAIISEMLSLIIEDQSAPAWLWVVTLGRKWGVDAPAVARVLLSERSSDE